MATVNKPTDTKQKEADINRKLQLYGIISAFSNGKVPSNEQIDVALNSFLASRALARPHEKLSTEGKELIADVRDVVEQAKRLLLSKNEGNLLQDFIWQTQQFDPKAISTPDAPVGKETAKEHGNQALQGFRTLGTLIITNGQFRKLLSDATVLLRDMAGDAATKAATKVRPDEDQLRQIDQPAQDNVWHDTPDISKDGLKQQARGVYKGAPVEDAKAAANAGLNAAQQSGPGDRLDPRAGLNAAANMAQHRADENLDDDTKEKAQARKEEAKARKEEYRRRTKDYFNKKMPEERKDQIVWRLKKMVLECQQHPDYAEAVTTLLDLAEEYSGHGRNMAAGGTDTVQETRGNLAAAEADLKTLIERFANGTSSDDLWDSINVIYRDADQDPELKDWFKAMDRYIRRCLLEQGYILDDQSTRDWDRLYDHGRYLLRDKYRGHTDRVIDETKFLADQFDQDTQNKTFAQSVQKLFTDLGHDENGKASFKPHLVKDLTDVILPGLFENVAYIPIPRIEYTDPQFDAIIENLVLESDNFMPNVFEVEAEHYFRFGRKKAATSTARQTIEVKVKGIQMDLRDVSYHIKRKQGFPSITDTGIANIKLAGDGFSFKLRMSTADEKDRANFFKVDKVDIDVNHFNIKLVKSNHKLLFNLFKPIMLKVLRPALQKAGEKAIRDQVARADALLWQIKQEADRALQQAANDPEQAQNIYQRYVSAAQKKILQGKKKAAEVAADKKVNMAVTKEDSIFPNIHLPGGISSKATEYKELARKGDKWESPVFSIGQAARSSNIPAAPKVVRKPHSTATPGQTQNGSLNGGHHANGHGYNSAIGNPPMGYKPGETGIGSGLGGQTLAAPTTGRY